MNYLILHSYEQKFSILRHKRITDQVFQGLQWKNILKCIEFHVPTMNLPSIKTLNINLTKNLLNKMTKTKKNSRPGTNWKHSVISIVNLHALIVLAPVFFFDLQRHELVVGKLKIASHVVADARFFGHHVVSSHQSVQWRHKAKLSAVICLFYYFITDNTLASKINLKRLTFNISHSHSINMYIE